MTVEPGAFIGGIATIVAAVIVVGGSLGIFMHREFCSLRERMARREGLFEGFFWVGERLSNAFLFC